MSAVVADTHTVIWLLFSPHHLSANALASLEGAIQSGEPIYVTSITIVEVTYLVEKGRLPFDMLAQLNHEVAQPDSGLVVIALDHQIAQTLRMIPYATVPDMPDRIIAATALYLGAPLVTRDARIRSANIPTIW
jgi:PIN domain nuclease of toxin-antitoxin system